MANDYKKSIEQAKEDIRLIKEEVKKLEVQVVESSNKISASLKTAFNIKDIGQLKSQLKDLQTQIEALNTTVKKFSENTTNLSTAKKNLHKVSSQEKTDIQAINKENKLHSKRLSTMTGAYANLIAKQKLAKNSLQDLIASGKKAGQTQKQYNAQVKKAQGIFNKYTARVNQAKKATSNFANTGLGSMVRGFRNLISAFGVIGGVTLFASVVKSAFKLTKQLDSLGFSMRAVIKDQRELAQTQDFLKQISQDFGAELVTVTNRYIKFRAATQQAGLSAKETQKIFGTMTKAAGVLGLKTDELKGIFLALEQMVSKGKITTEELRRQLGERLPGAMDIMANSMGVTTSELDKMLKKGEVLTKDVLPGFAKQVEIAFGLQSIDRVETLQAATTRLSNAWVLLVQDFNDGNNASNALRKVFDFLANNLKTIIDSIGLLIVSYGAFKTAQLLLFIQTKLLSKALWEQVGAWVAQRAAMVKTIFTLKGLKAAFVGLWRVVVTNPLIALLAVATLAVVLFKDWGKTLLETAKELNKVNKEITEVVRASVEQNREVKKLIDRYDELKNATQLSSAEQKELKDIIIAIGKAFPQATISVDKYGNAIEISTEKTKKLLKENEELNKLKASKTLEEETAQLEKLNTELNRVNSGQDFRVNGLLLVNKETGVFVKRTASGVESLRDLTKQEKITYLEYLKDLKATIFDTEKLINLNNEMFKSDPDPSGLRNKLQEEELKRITDAMEAGVKALPKLRKELSELETSLEDLTKNGYDNLNQAQIDAIIKTRDEIKDKKKLIKEITGETDARKKAKNLIVDSIGWLKEEIKLNNEKIEKSKDKSVIENLQEENKENQKRIDLLLGVQKALEGSIPFQEANIKKLEEQRSKLSTTGLEYSKYTKQIEAAKEELIRMKAAIEGVNAGLKKEGVNIDIGIDFDGLNDSMTKFFDDYEEKIKNGENATKAFSDLMKNIFGGLTDTFSQFFDLDISKFDFIFDSISDKTNKLFSKDNIKEWADLSKELIGSVLDASLQRYEIELQEAQRSRDLILNDDLASEEQKRLARTRFEREERRIKTDRAKQDRKNTLIKIAVDTAAAVVKVLAQTGTLAPFVIPSIIAIGLTQAAIVAAQPLPKFEKGTQNAPEGWALTQERQAEPITDKYGALKTFGDSKGSALTYLKKGDKVYKSRADYMKQSVDEIDRAVWNMNLRSNGQELSPFKVDKELIGEMKKNNDILTRKKMSMKINQTINIGDDISFLMYKNDTL